jgi:hypothetical protein
LVEREVTTREQHLPQRPALAVGFRPQGGKGVGLNQSQGSEEFAEAAIAGIEVIDKRQDRTRSAGRGTRYVAPCFAS